MKKKVVFLSLHQTNAFWSCIIISYAQSATQPRCFELNPFSNGEPQVIRSYALYIEHPSQKSWQLKWPHKGTVLWLISHTHTLGYCLPNDYLHFFKQKKHNPPTPVLPSPALVHQIVAARCNNETFFTSLS